MTDRIELCRHRYPAGGLCRMEPEAEIHEDPPPPTWIHPEIAHPYEPAVLVPLPLDREAIYEAVGIEMFGPEGPLTGPDERTVRYAADAALDAVLGVTE